MLYFATEIIQEATAGQPIVVVAVHVDGGVSLGGRIWSGVCEATEQIIVLELGV